MARHHFGKMPLPPKAGERFDTFEPDKYACEAVDDSFIEPILNRLSGMDCFSHSLDNPVKGLNYCGITLIPPESLDCLINAFNGAESTDDIIDFLMLLSDAQRENAFVIHFGI